MYRVFYLLAVLETIRSIPEVIFLSMFFPRTYYIMLNNCLMNETMTSPVMFVEDKQGVVCSMDTLTQLALYRFINCVNDKLFGHIASQTAKQPNQRSPCIKSCIK